jgi:hypothetical protein
MNVRSRAGHARWWLRLALASGLTVGVFALHSLPADAAPSGSQTVLAGLSSQGYPSFFEISSNARTLRLGAIALDIKCTSGTEFVLEDQDVRIPITRSGKLRADFAQAPTPVSGGSTVGGVDSLNATLNRQDTKLTGTWRLQQTIISASGQTDQCDSGLVQFRDLG